MSEIFLPNSKGLSQSHAELVKILEELQPHIDPWEFPVGMVERIEKALLFAKAVVHG